MTLCFTTLKLHPFAEEDLFAYYRAFRSIFRDVVGLLEIDYIGLTLINTHNQVLFFSSYPSIEYNILEQDLWHQDPCLSEAFHAQDKLQFWQNLYQPMDDTILLYYKKEKPAFSLGFSMPDKYRNYTLVYSYGLKHATASTKYDIDNNQQILKNMGRYCVNAISELVPYLSNKIHSLKKPSLTLVINNK